MPIGRIAEGCQVRGARLHIIDDVKGRAQNLQLGLHRGLQLFDEAFNGLPQDSPELGIGWQGRTRLIRIGHWVIGSSRGSRLDGVQVDNNFSLLSGRGINIHADNPTVGHS